MIFQKAVSIVARMFGKATHKILHLTLLLWLSAIFPATASDQETLLGSSVIPRKLERASGQFGVILDTKKAIKSQSCIVSEQCAGETAIWLKTLQTKGDGMPTIDKLMAVQDYFSTGYKQVKGPQWSYEYEKRGIDIWKDVGTFVADRGGDCEDFAIVKAAALYALGLKDMRIVVLRDELNGGTHAVLAVTEDKITYILDNRLSGVVHDDSLLVRAYRPLFYLEYAPMSGGDTASGGLFGLHKPYALVSAND